MLLAFKIIIYFCFTGLLLSVLLNKELEESIPVVFIFDGIIISIFAYLQNVYLGIYISVYAIPVILLIYTLILIKQKKITLKDIYGKFSIRNICIIILFVYSYLMSTNKYISQPDEIHLWAIRVFDMLKNNSLVTQCSIATTRSYLRYPLFLNSFQCLFCYIGGGYKEPILFFATISFCFSLLLNLVTKLKINKLEDCYKLFCFLALFIILGICYRYPIYINIMSDAPIAIFAAITFYMAYLCDLNNKKDVLILVMYIVALLMSKQICLLFVALIIIYIFINILHFNNIKKFIIFFIVLFFLGIVSVIGISKVLSFKALNSIIDSISTYGLKGSYIISSYFYNIFHRDIYAKLFIKTSYFYFLLISCAVFIIINIFNKDKLLREKNIVLSTILFLGGIIWSFAFLYYTFHISQDYAAHVTTVTTGNERYLETYLYMVIITLFAISISNSSYYPKVLSFIIPFTLVLCVPNTKDLTKIIPNYTEVGIIVEPKFLKRLDILDTIPDNSNLLIIDQNLKTAHGYGYDEYTSYYYYIYGMNKNAKTELFGDNQNVTDEYERYSIEDISLKEYVSEVSNFDYIYLSFVDEKYINNYWNPTTDINIYNNGLYKILNINKNQIELQFIETFE